MGEENGKKIKEATEGVQDLSKKMPEKFADRNTGVGGEQNVEIPLSYKQEQNEIVTSSPYGSQIVLGKDVKYGFLGHGKAAAIDIVVGRAGASDSKARKKNEKKWVKITPKNDSARIYISQKTNLDKLFEMPRDNLNNTPETCSGIGIKADTVRMISRNNIRIQSGCDTILSNELKNPEKVGIDLFAGVPYNGEENYNEEMCLVEGRDDMQPIPKGDNLEEALEYIAKMLDTISGVLINFIKLQQQFNNDISIHTHLETFFGNNGIPSKDVIGPLLENNVSILEECTEDTFEYKVNYLGNFQDKYLNKASNKYINSKYHRLN